MTGATTAIVLGSGSIMVLIVMLVIERGKPKPEAERRLFRKWLTSCCLALVLLLVAPGILEVLDLMPLGSFGALGGILFFFVYFVPSISWYCRRLSRIREGNELTLRIRRNGSL